MSPSSPPPREEGFVLLEVLVALLIFATVVLAWADSTDAALEAAARANGERTLRMLAARKLGEIRAKPASCLEGDEGGFEEEVDVGEANPFLDYRWEVEAQETVAAGHADEDEVEFLFEADRNAENAAPSEPGAKAPDPIRLLRLTLTVSHVPGDGEDGDRIRVVTFVPMPPEGLEGEGTGR